MKMNGVVYYLSSPMTNEIFYIGITKNFDKRMKQHAVEYKKSPNYPKNCKISKLKRFGYNFSCGIIQTLHNVYEHELKEAEIYWISYFKNIGCRLTNCTAGGGGLLNPSDELRRKMSMRGFKKIFDNNGVIYNSIEEAAIQLKINRTTISNILSGRIHASNGYTFSFVNDYVLTNGVDSFTKEMMNIAIKMAQQNRQIVDHLGQIHKSQSEAAKALSISESLVLAILQGHKPKWHKYRHIKLLYCANKYIPPEIEVDWESFNENR